MRQKTFLLENGYKHITTRINQITGQKEHLFYNSKTKEQINVIEKEV